MILCTVLSRLREDVNECNLLSSDLMVKGNLYRIQFLILYIRIKYQYLKHLEKINNLHVSKFHRSKQSHPS